MDDNKHGGGTLANAWVSDQNRRIQIDIYGLVETMNEDMSDRAGQPEDTEREDSQWQVWVDELGMERPPKFRDDSQAPPVDEPLLRRLLGRELPEYQGRGVLLLVISYRSWYDAYTRLLLAMNDRRISRD